VPLSFIGDYFRTRRLAAIWPTSFPCQPTLLPKPSNSRSTPHATHTTVADTGRKGPSAACKRKVICSWDIPASTLSAKQSWGTLTTATFVRDERHQHRFTSFYQFDKSVQLGIYGVGRASARHNRTLADALQVDTIYIF